jgi:hypothetical protein
LPVDPAARLERLKNLTAEQLAIMGQSAPVLRLTEEAYTLQEAAANAQEHGFGASRPVTPRVGSMVTEPVARVLHLTPEYGRWLHRAHR